MDHRAIVNLPSENFNAPGFDACKKNVIIKVFFTGIFGSISPWVEIFCQDLKVPALLWPIDQDYLAPEIIQKHKGSRIKRKREAIVLGMDKEHQEEKY